jgi:hypothetical protein
MAIKECQNRETLNQATDNNKRIEVKYDLIIYAGRCSVMEKPAWAFTGLIHSSIILAQNFKNGFFLCNFTSLQNDCSLDQGEVRIGLWKIPQQPFGFKIDIFTK